MEYKFKVEFLEPVMEFLESLDQKSREKILYNIWKSRSVNNNELFKKLDGEIWEFRTLYNKPLEVFKCLKKSFFQPTIQKILKKL